MKKCIFFLFLIFQLFESHSQMAKKSNYITQDSIVLYAISDSLLISVIDSFIEQEKNYCYFDDCCSFQISAGRTVQDSCLYVFLESGFSADIAYIKQINRKELVEQEMYVVLYEKHLIFVENKYSMGLLSDYMNSMGLLSDHLTQNCQKYVEASTSHPPCKKMWETDTPVKPNTWICFFLQDGTISIAKMYGTIPMKK